jgi:hypothetical protein
MANNFSYHITENQAIFLSSIVIDTEYKDRQDQVMKAPAIGLEIEKQCEYFADESPEQLAMPDTSLSRLFYR